MRDLPPDLDEGGLLAALDDGWGVRAGSLRHLPVGFGSHHWSAVDRAGASWFVKVDVGDFDRLGRSYATAAALRREAGLDFVLAPVPARDGTVLRRLSQRYAMTLFPLVDAPAGDFGPHRPAELAEMAGLLGALHRATPAVVHLAPRADLALPGRAGLTAALAELDRPWTGGPHSEAARALLTEHRALVEGWLADFDRLVDVVRGTEREWVVTHGEPHPGNVLRTAAGPMLIDWATVEIAPPERDLWMLTDSFATMLGAQPAGRDDEVLARYGQGVSAAGLALYRRWWPLADVAAFVDDLHAPHGDGEDAAAALTFLAGYLRG